MPRGGHPARVPGAAAARTGAPRVGSAGAVRAGGACSAPALVDPAGYHATVHFFGPLAAEDLRRAQALCGQVVEALAAPLRCGLAGLAQLPPRGPARVVHAVLGEGHGAVAAFLDEARNRIAAAAFPVPARSPLPHVTVARVRHGQRWRMTEPVALPAAPFVLDELVLFESHLRRSGVRYVALTSRRPAAG